MRWEFFDSDRFNELIFDLLYINIFWGLVNLLPIYPLDGGQIAHEVLSVVNPRDGLRQSLWLSVIVAAGLAVLAGTRLQDKFLAIFFGYFAYTSYMTLQQPTVPEAAWGVSMKRDCQSPSAPHDAPPAGLARRVVLVGASNLTKGIGTVLPLAEQIWGSPLEVYAALGHGRSYGRGRACWAGNCQAFSNRPVARAGQGAAGRHGRAGHRYRQRPALRIPGRADCRLGESGVRPPG